MEFVELEWLEKCEEIFLFEALFFCYIYVVPRGLFTHFEHMTGNASLTWLFLAFWEAKTQKQTETRACPSAGSFPKGSKSLSLVRQKNEWHGWQGPTSWVTTCSLPEGTGTESWHCMLLSKNQDLKRGRCKIIEDRLFLKAIGQRVPLRE